jgi:proteasome lid subunit RPN8/RPN11
MLILKKELYEQIIRQCLREFPQEACGIVAGKEGMAEKVYEMTNTDESPLTFFMEPQEQLQVMKEIRNTGLDMIGIYHSHMASDAYPSRRDVDLALYPEVLTVILSLSDKNNPSIRSFKINGDRITEEATVIE